MAKQPYAPSTSDASVRKATGRTWAEWFAYLNGWATPAHDHKAVAAHLASIGVPPWWSQMVTVEWERSTGRRAVHQTTRGFEAQVSKSVPATPEECWEAFAKKSAAQKWLGPDCTAELKAGGAWRDPNGVATVSSATKPRRIGLSWTAHGRRKAHRVEVQFLPTKSGSTSVRITHSGLASERAVEASKAMWRPLLERLRLHLAPT